MPNNLDNKIHSVEEATNLFVKQAELYISQGSTDKAKSLRKKQMIAYIVAGLYKFSPECPYNMTWDPITQTCK